MKYTKIYSLLFTMYVTRTVLHVSSLSVIGSGVISSKYISGNDVVSTQARRRLKRNPMSSYLASKGAEVAKILLRGASHIQTKNRNIRIFTKPGTFETAVAEFKALNPINIESANTFNLYQSSLVSGKVGDRLIVIERKGNVGNPTMSILRENNGVYDQADTIIYTNVPRIGSRRAGDFVDRRQSVE